ncbi:Peptidoglycan/LPS O-acetylase OafA/YrhL, contains acyltransferase and SGNH-hydrolase domains [Micromonospora rhizosphaerae]|uniref:Peptidoglycan/LPS O-acetylase OafA/YrhL, contains acyltransferase and SGNH-hydrolase domains n=1 Tax=Micromonospora rhizosphaerae TaxID=568872 RepID=A0A1C6RE75_9ACTN|nr:acyltransferase [Micromonospora rhizosphaerae]SCL15266.1 Peptidoglycan/LPS O-acetylase OafA/YrhL, contains acyltransferase and SGNH-hydrolase domains [Micromonospora rhizosphaerae]
MTSASTTIRSTPSAAARLDSLTGLRWIAALMIFCLHIQSESNFFVADSRAQQALNSIMAAGRSGVSFFYILSGFVLAWSVRPTDTTSRFWWRRFSKIYPNHFVTFLVACLLLSWRGMEVVDFERMFYNLTLLHSWVPGRGDVWYSFNAPSWSLSCEAFFYLCFPLLYAGLRRVRPVAWWVIAGTSALFIVVLPFGIKVFHEPFGWSEHFIVYHLPPVRMIEFLLGMCLALLVRGGRWRGPGMTVSILVVLAGMTVAAYLPEQYGLVRDAACTVLGYSLLLPACALADVRQSRSIWRTPRLVYLGEVSFAFYMVHEICLYAVRHTFGDDEPHRPTVAAGVLVLATFCMALVAAMILHHAVELPMMRLLTGGRRRTSAGRGTLAGGPGTGQGAVPAQPGDDPARPAPQPVAAAMTHRIAAS